RRIWGRPLGGKATVRIIQHQGTSRPIERWETINFDRTYTMTVNLDEGRRTSAEYVPPTPARRPQSTSEPETPDRVLTKLRNLADPEYVAGEPHAQGGLASLGLPTTPPRPLPRPASRGKDAAVIYQTKVPGMMNSGFELMAQVSDALDG